MPWNPITTEEIQPDQPITGEGGTGRKIKDNFEYLYGRIESVGGEAVLQNPSFELDTDNDGIPDGWTRFLYPNGRMEIIGGQHGAKAVRFTHPGGTGNGGGYIESDYIIISPTIPAINIGWLMVSSVAGIRNDVVVRFFDINKGLISETTIYASTTNPTAWTYFIRPVDVIPTNARFMKIRFVGGNSAVSTGGTTTFDGIRLIELPLSFRGPNFTLPEGRTNATIWVDVNSVAIVPTVNVSRFDLRFFAQLRAPFLGTAYQRFRIGTVYSNETSTSSTSYINFYYEIIGHNITGSFTLVQQLMTNEPRYFAYGRKPDPLSIMVADIL